MTFAFFAPLIDECWEESHGGLTQRSAKAGKRLSENTIFTRLLSAPPSPRGDIHPANLTNLLKFRKIPWIDCQERRCHSCSAFGLAGEEGTLGLILTFRP